MWYARSQVNELIEAARAQFGEKSFTASEFRDFFATSRKYAIPILEHLDSRQVTYRQGDNRYFVQTK